MSAYNNILIDLSELYHRSFSIKRKEITDGRRLLNETIQLTVKQILNIRKQYLADEGLIWILKDNPTSKLRNRKLLDVSYKSTRLKESDPFYRGLDFTFILLSKYDSNINCVRIKALEADDLVKPVLESLPNSSRNLLVSADMDWARCMSSSTDWLTRTNLFNQETFKEYYKFTPNENTVTLYKAILGDSSDNIPCIKGINEQTALNIVYNFYDVFDLLENIQRKTEKSNLLSDYTKKHLMENKDRLVLNHQLIYFNFVSSEEVKHATIKGSFNENALKILYTQLDFPAHFDKRIKRASPKIEDIFGFDEIKRK